MAPRSTTSANVFEQAFHNSPAMQTVTRVADRTLIEVNEAFLTTLGYTRAEVVGQSTPEFNFWVHPEKAKPFREELFARRSVRGYEVEVRTKRGEIRTVLLSADMVEIGGEPHIVAAGVDITERKQAEAEQQKALHKERELSQLKTDFVALVSHEFRTPLEIIMSSVDNLDRYHDRLPAEKRQELLHTINKSVRRMAGMMEEVLLLGRLDASGTEFRPAPLDITAMCQRVCDEMESATNRRCPIALRIGEALGDVRGDEILLRHILTNLLSNAVKYSETGQTVDLEVGRDVSTFIFRVHDRGRGIPAPDQKRVFQAFHRGSNVRQIPGTGLGLLIVRRCVALHGGEIDFESSEGRGTTFTVRLPLSPSTGGKTESDNAFAI